MSASALDHLRTIRNLKAVWEDFWRRTGGKSSAGIDGITPAAFRDQIESRLHLLKVDLDRGYRFGSLRGVAIPKKDPSKLRLICVPTVADRIVQRALLGVIEQRSAKLGIYNSVSFGFVRRIANEKGGTHGARQAAVKYRQQWPWVFKADISRFFDNIRREDLATDLCRTLRLKSLSPLIRGAISCEVLANDGRVRSAIAQNGITVGRGLRQGMPLSPILSNFVLREFDKIIGARYPMVRYADDLIIFADSEATRDKAARMVEDELRKLGLATSADKTFWVAPGEAVEFLGMELGPKPSGLSYQLVISNAQMDEIRSTFSRYHSSDHADSDGLNASKLFRRLEQMRVGYYSAYWGADNLKEFEGRLDTWMSECCRKVYVSIFGQQAVDRLTRPQRRFLMLA